MNTGARVSQRDLYLAEADSLTRKKTEFTKEDKARVDSLIALADACGEEGMRMRRARMAQLDLDRGIRRSEEISTPEIEANFRDYLRRGKDALYELGDRRQLAVGTGSAGGYMAPQSFYDRLTTNLRAYDGLFEACSTWRSTYGTAATGAIENDVTAVASIVTENDDEGLATDLAFESAAFAAVPLWRSGVIRVTRELSQDSYFELSTVVADAMARRFARGIAPTLVATLLAGADVGVTTSSTSAIVADEVLDLAASLDNAYWPNASWCMAKSTYIALIKLGLGTDASAAAVTFNSLNLSQPMLLGKRVYICPSFDAIAAGKTVISFGDHTWLVRREVAGGLEVQTLNERYAEFGLTGYVGRWRTDSGTFLKPGTYGSPAVSSSPVKLLVMHS